jgi:hypothetical protein
MNYLKKTSLLSLLFLAACFPKEDAVDPTPRVNKSVSLDAGEFKNTVAFYSLDEAKTVTEASPMDWDFYIDENVVRLNYFRSMRVAKFNDTWDKLEDTIGLDFKYLTSDNESTLSQWELAEDQIYVVDYGFDNEYKPIGLTSVRFERTSDGMKLWYNPIGSDFEVFEEIKEASFYYNLREKKSLDLPTEKEYDLGFGKYTDFATVDGITLEYLLYGAIQANALSYVEALPFDEVKSEAVDDIKYSEKKNIIGWDWKNFNLAKGTYEIIENRTYLVSSNADFDYKLRFVSFLNDKGSSGHPTFEWELL